ncbi:MAG: hypothetical protein J5517_07175 [Eubacterium sp.]|nr:hypothetical protein [Eubacterium sp.]
MYNNGRKQSLIRGLDPRIKLYMICIYILMSLVTWKLIPVLIVFFAGLVLTWLCGHRIKYLWDISASAVCIELLIGLLFMFWLKPIYVLYIIMKLVSITFVFNAVIRCFKQHELLDGLISGFKLRTDTAKRVFLILQFYPSLEKQKKRVRNALKARGVDPDQGNMLTRFRTELVLSVPNYKSTYVESKRKSVAMNVRDFTSVRRRRRVTEMKLNFVDELFLIAEVVILLVAVYIQLFI